MHRPRVPAPCVYLIPLVVRLVAPSLAGEAFRRGDSNGDGELDVSDPVRTVLALYSGGVELGCLDAADTNDDGSVDLSDSVYSLGFLFRGGPAPPEPFPACGADPTPDGLGCETQPLCQGDDPHETIVSPDVVVLDPAATSIDFADEGSVTISGSLGGLEAGKVLVSGEGVGLLRRVESITPSGAGYLLRTSAATLEDVFQEADIESEATLDLGDVQSFIPEVDGARIVIPEPAGDGGGAAVSSSEAELEVTPLTIAVAPGVTLTVSTKVTVKMDLLYRLRISRNFLGLPKLQRFLFNPKLTVAGKVTAKLAAAVDVPVFEQKIGTAYFAPIVIPAGPVPVVVTPVIEAFVKLNAKGEVGIELGPTLTVTAEGKIAYDTVAGWTSGAPVPVMQFDPGLVPNVYAAISAEAALAPRISLLLYGSTGPYIELATPFLKAEAKVQAAPPQWEFSVDAGLKMLLGVQAKTLVKDFSYSAEVIKTSINIYKKVYPLDPCAPDPDNPNAPKFIRGDVNNDGRLDMSDATQLLGYLIYGWQAPVDCSGQANLDVGDVNDNEYVTLTDALQLLAYLFHGGPAPAPPGTMSHFVRPVPGVDPDDSTRGFDRQDPAYGVRAARSRVVDGRIILDLEVKSPAPVAGFMLALRTPSSLHAEKDLILPPDVQPDSIIATEGGHLVSGEVDPVQGTATFGFQLARLPGDFPAGTRGAYLPLCSVAFTAEGPEGGEWFEWLPNTSLHGMNWRAAVIDTDFQEHHPILSLDASVPARRS